MEPSEQNERNEEARRAVLAYLAVRQAIAQAPSTIHRRVNKDGHDFAMREIEAALVFLEGDRLVKKIESRFGSACHYQATSEGVLLHERGA